MPKNAVTVRRIKVTLAQADEEVSCLIKRRPFFNVTGKLNIMSSPERLINYLDLSLISGMRAERWLPNKEAGFGPSISLDAENVEVLSRGITKELLKVCQKHLKIKFNSSQR
jgi:hypothetical protein